MTTIDFISALFCQVDDHLAGIPKHPEAHRWPSEVVTLGLLHAFKGVGNRAFYRWLTRDYRALFPQLPEQTLGERRGQRHQTVLAELALTNGEDAHLQIDIGDLYMQGFAHAQATAM
jgi:hypothetical protein